MIQVTPLVIEYTKYKKQVFWIQQAQEKYYVVVQYVGA